MPTNVLSDLLHLYQSRAHEAKMLAFTNEICLQATFGWLLAQNMYKMPLQLHGKTEGGNSKSALDHVAKRGPEAHMKSAVAPLQLDAAVFTLKQHLIMLNLLHNHAS